MWVARRPAARWNSPRSSGTGRSISILKSVYLTCKHVLPVMEAQGGGAIVNTASTSGIRWTGAAQVGYASSKAGVIQFSRVVAVQYAKRNIRVNTVVPARCTRPWWRPDLRDKGPAATWMPCSSPALPASRSASWATAATRPPLPLFLASDEARFVTGTEIVVDGGMSARCD